MSEKRFRLFGAAAELFGKRDSEILLSGPAGTGKSLGCLAKLHACAMSYPGMRGLILRQTRESLTESALVTFENKLLSEDSSLLSGASRESRRAYQYPNGSTIVVSGLKQSGKDLKQKVMSTDYDMVYVQEAIELAAEDWEKLTTRLRNNVMPYQQVIADTNPDTPIHWLKRRCDSGMTVLLESRHEDNPELWDRDKGEWTENDKKYLAKLDALTGPRLARLRHGRWVQAEGVVYDGWDRTIHLVPHFKIPDDWPRYWAIDFGYTNPFVCQWWAQDPDGRLYRYREIYRTHRLVEEHAKNILVASGKEPRPKAVICDTDAEDRATLEKHLGMATRAAVKDVSPGIQAVASRLRKQGDGKPRLFLLEDALIDRDPELVEQKKPTCSEEEVDSYVWDTRENRKRGEEPMKAFDHGMDAMRYCVAYFDLEPPKRKLQAW